MKYQDFIEYEEMWGFDFAVNLFLLCGPDGFIGTKEDYCKLENRYFNCISN